MPQPLLDLISTNGRNLHENRTYQMDAVPPSRPDSIPQPGQEVELALLLRLNNMLMSTFRPGKKLASNGAVLSISCDELRSCKAYSFREIFCSPGMFRNRAASTDSRTSHEFISSRCTGATRPNASVRINGSCIQHGPNSLGTRA